MKKLFVSLLLCMASVVAFSQNVIPMVGSPLNFAVLIVDPTVPVPLPKSPVQSPTVSIDGHTLYLYDIGYDLALCLVDENDDVVYTVFVPAGTTSVVLPSTFTGSFELQLFPGGLYYFVSDITL